jgi:hypothetical protein
MTVLCDWGALVAFAIALLLCLIQPSPTPARWTWPTFVALGLLAWAIPIALTASHIAHS